MALEIRQTDGVQHTEEYLREVFARRHPTGIYAGVGGALAVTAPGGRLVQVAAGELEGNGFWVKLAAAENVPIAANNTGATRIDRVVVRINTAPSPSTAELVALTGTAVAPAITRSGAIYDLYLARISVANGATTLVAGDITDEREYTAATMTADGTAGTVVSTTSATPQVIAPSVPITTIGGPLDIDVTINFTVTVACSPSWGYRIDTNGVAGAPVTMVSNDRPAGNHTESFRARARPAAGAHFVSPTFAVNAGTLTVTAIGRYVILTEVRG